METSNKHSRYVAHFDMLGFKNAVYRNHDEAWGALTDLRKAMDRIPAYGIKDVTTEKDIFQKSLYRGGCPTIAFCCDRLQTSSTALERPKYPQRSISCASGDSALSALSTKFSLDLTTNTILGRPPRFIRSIRVRLKSKSALC